MLDSSAAKHTRAAGRRPHLLQFEDGRVDLHSTVTLEHVSDGRKRLLSYSHLNIVGTQAKPSPVSPAKQNSARFAKNKAGAPHDVNGDYNNDSYTTMDNDNNNSNKQLLMLPVWTRQQTWLHPFLNKKVLFRHKFRGKFIDQT